MAAKKCPKLKCDFCTKVLREMGALLFSPPTKKGIVKKFHVCAPCYYGAITRIIKNRLWKSS